MIDSDSLEIIELLVVVKFITVGFFYGGERTLLIHYDLKFYSFCLNSSIECERLRLHERNFFFIALTRASLY